VAPPRGNFCRGKRDEGSGKRKLRRRRSLATSQQLDVIESQLVDMNRQITEVVKILVNPLDSTRRGALSDVDGELRRRREVLNGVRTRSTVSHST
jgi:hypothetical protein